MTIHKRTIEVSRSSVDVEAGTFEAVVFTGGEASDGHVLDIQGGRIPAEIPLFVNHSADPRTQLGVLKRIGKTDNEVLMKGHVLVEGEGAEAEIRRDILLKMSRGMVRNMSGRWDADEKDVVRRVNLPADHPAYVSDKANGAKRWGLYFKRWSAMEGSVVGLGADPAATMRWAEEAESPAVAQFWRSAAEPVVQPDREAMLAAFAATVRELAEAGITPRELIAELEPQSDPIEEAKKILEEELSSRSVGDITEEIDEDDEGEAAIEEAQAQSRTATDPIVPEPVQQTANVAVEHVDADYLAALLRREILAFRSLIRADSEAALNAALGRVTHGK